MSVYPRKDGVYVFDFKIRGVRFYGPTGLTTRREAERYEDDRREQAKATLKARADSRDAPLTVNAAIDRFWLEAGQHYTGSYGKTVGTALDWLVVELEPNTLLANINSSRIAETIGRRRGEGVSNATVNRTVTELLRRLFKRADDVWKQPVQKIKWSKLLLPEPKERVRELRDHEEIKLAENMRNDYLPALAFFVVTGCRLNEVVILKKDAFDWTTKTVVIRGKGDKERVIPLTGEMIAIVTPLWDHHPEFVFTYIGQRARKHPVSGKTIGRGLRYPITYSGMKTTWRRYGGAKAGLVDFRLHDTRHTAATRLLRETGNLKLAQHLLGHEDISTTAKYAHADTRDLRSGMERVTESRKNSRMAGFAAPKVKVDQGDGK